MTSLVAAVACAAVPVGARAQEAQDKSENLIIGPPQLKDFRLVPQERIVEQPPPEPRADSAAPPSAPDARPESRPAPSPDQTPVRRPAPAESAPLQTGNQAEAEPPLPEARAPSEFAAPAPSPASEPGPAAPEQAAPAATSYWLYAVPALVLALLGVAAVRRRRRRPQEAVEAPEPPPAAAPPPQPVPRPWLELELKAERASLTEGEAEVAFELTVRNAGKSPAQNVRINARMFNAGARQDREVGGFFRTRGEGRKTFTIPSIEAEDGVIIGGTVTLPREEMRAVAIDSRQLFIPVIGVNAVYDWGEARTGQTSKSYIVGREVAGPEARMGAFRVDLGPRVWRTVGLREHSLSRRI